MNALIVCFYFQVFMGVFDMFLNMPPQNLPFNTGWIIITGFLTVISALENKK